MKKIPFRKYPSTSSLQCFEATARHLSFTQAAKELHMTQSAVSKQVALLESVLETEVFIRQKQRLTLTPVGQKFLEETREILSKIEDSVLNVLAHGSEAATLRIVTHPTFGSRWLMKKLKGFGAAHPNIHLDIHDELGDFCNRAYSDMDIGFLHGCGTWPGLQSVKLLSGDFVAVCAPGIDVPPLEAICNQGCTLIQSRIRPRAWTEYLFNQGISCEDTLKGPRFDSFFAVIHAALAGCGVALVPELLIKEELDSGRLKIAWPYRLQVDGAYYMVYPQNMKYAPHIKTMVDWILKQLDEPTSSDDVG
ncbi:LysR substrate-binding domain-containing protein [Pelistega europaea]|uniref:LysR family transcriptional regulator n=1 Tax=Pelistega europaea TaxID=106147 RepID=A0A7Y4LAF7_9BURK|nr:LysR substrate-binding domain-containing protein [Pelistega europaea]NOL49984.1 LysR family transcriptional regulator [Pelistega europaea]